MLEKSGKIRKIFIFSQSRIKINSIKIQFAFDIILEQNIDIIDMDHRINMSSGMANNVVLYVVYK